ncbi:hypothetical protein [Cetobacterium sp.]|uniref:hypothetical protein n=1 Tax=Cetobacterium sp. TaxID=2071632 RepID=UPI003F3EBBD9
MKKVYKLKDNKFKEQFEYYYNNINKVKADFAEEAIEIFGLNLTLEQTENKIGISNELDLYFNNKFVEELGMEKLFTPIASMDIRDKNGNWLGVWSCLKRNRKQYKLFEKFKEDYHAYDMSKMFRPRLHFVLGKVTTHYLNKEMYILTNCSDKEGVEWLKENTVEIKMSEYYLEIEKLQNKEVE